MKTVASDVPPTGTFSIGHREGLDEGRGEQQRHRPRERLGGRLGRGDGREREDRDQRAAEDDGCDDREEPGGLPGHADLPHGLGAGLGDRLRTGQVAPPRLADPGLEPVCGGAAEVLCHLRLSQGFSSCQKGTRAGRLPAVATTFFSGILLDADDFALDQDAYRGRLPPDRARHPGKQVRRGVDRGGEPRPVGARRPSLHARPRVRRVTFGDGEHGRRPGGGEPRRGDVPLRRRPGQGTGPGSPRCRRGARGLPGRVPQHRAVTGMQFHQGRFSTTSTWASPTWRRARRSTRAALDAVGLRIVMDRCSGPARRSAESIVIEPA